MSNETIATYINDIADQKTRRAVQAVFDNLGSVIADDSLKQKSMNRTYTLEEFENCPVVARKDTGGSPEAAMALAIVKELRADHATAKTEIEAIGATLANYKTIYDAHTHECPGSSYAASRCSTPDTGAAENSLAASVASAYTDTSGSSVPATLTANADPVGTAGDENLLIFDDNIFEYHVLGTQTISAPVRSATGLNIGMDQTDNDGVEITQGILANSRSAFVVGTSKPFALKVKLAIPDVTGTDDLAIGFRKAEAYQAAIDNYDEMAALNVISGNITVETILNAATTAATDTTDDWADAAKKTLEVYVDSNGVVTFKIDGVAPSTTATFTFDDGEVVVPFIYFLHATDVAGAVTIQSYECGLQSAME